MSNGKQRSTVNLTGRQNLDDLRRIICTSSIWKKGKLLSQKWISGIRSFFICTYPFQDPWAGCSIYRYAIPRTTIPPINSRSQAPLQELCEADLWIRCQYYLRFLRLLLSWYNRIRQCSIILWASSSFVYSWEYKYSLEFLLRNWDPWSKSHFTLTSVELLQMDWFGYIIYVAVIFPKAIDLVNPKRITVGSARFRRKEAIERRLMCFEVNSNRLFLTRWFEIRTHYYRLSIPWRYFINKEYRSWGTKPFGRKFSMAYL